MTPRRWLLVALAGLALFLVLGRMGAGIYAEWAWYASMGALPLYKSELTHEAVLRLGAALAGFVLAFGNLYAVRSSIVSLVLPRRLGNIEIGEAVPGRILTALVLVVSVVIAVLLALPQDDWASFALARIGVPFHELDPYNDRDFGFYVYRLPFERELLLWSLVAVLVVSAVVVFLYAITPSLRWERGRIYVSTYVRRHFAILIGLVLAIVAWSYRIEALSLLGAGSGAGGAFGAFDHRIALPLLTGLSFGSLVAAFVVAWAAWHGYHRVTLTILTVMLIAGPGARAVLPMLDRWSSTDAETRSRERPYLNTRILFTRRAFGVDQIVDADSARAAPMTADDVAHGASSWDAPAIAHTAELAHRGLSVAALAWTPSAGGLSAAVVLKPGSGSGPWTVALYDVTTADERGRALPQVAAAPASSETPMPPVLVEPGAAAYLVVADPAHQLVAPPFASWLERLAHAWYLRNPRMLAAEPPGTQARIMLHRDVRERIAALAPFFTIGPTLQAVVRGDSLYWYAELFVTSDDYPLSEPQLFAGQLRHYVRHAATAVVQAQTGRVLLLADANPDPMTRSWMRRFPWLFAPRHVLPSGLDALSPPNVDWALVQGAAVARTGFQGDTLNPHRLARPDDAFSIAEDSVPNLYAADGDRGPLASAVGLLDAEDRVIGALVARGGESPRTEWHRAARPVGWRDVLESLLNGSHPASPVHASLDDRRGRVQLFALKDGLAFAQTFYRWKSDAPPEIASVSILQGGQVKAGATIAEALGLARGATSTGAGAFRGKVAALYDQMSAALGRGDWKAFGDAYAALGRLLRASP